MDINKFASSQLANARHLARISLVDLSQKTGISVSALSRLLNGQHKSVAMADYFAVLTACNQPIKPYLDALARHVRRNSKT